MRRGSRIDAHALARLDLSGLSESSAAKVLAAIAQGENFHGYIPSQSLDFIIQNFNRLASLGALEAAWLDAYVHASSFAGYQVETLKAVFDACDRDLLLRLKPLGIFGDHRHGDRLTLFRGCAGPRHTLGMSWTPSLDKAIWYAAHHAEYYALSNLQVYVATFPISDVYCRLDHYDCDLIALPDKAWPVEVPLDEFRLDRCR